MKSPAILVAAALAASAGGAAAAVFRCTDAAGRVTYQDSPCDSAAIAHATDIPTDFPPPNEAERARILKQESELEQRLEARREREAREAALRIAATPAPSPPPEPQYTEAYPLYFPYAMPRPYPRHAQRGYGPHASRRTPTGPDR